MLAPASFTFVIGLSVLLISSQLFLNISQRLAASWKFSPLFISLVIVALGTNLPELTVTIAALAENDPGLAMGNLIGSSVANVTLIFGVATLFGKVRIGTTKTQKNALLLLVITILFAGLQFSSLEAVSRAFILFTAVVMALVYQYVLALNGRQHEDKKLIQIIDKLNRKKRRWPAPIYALGLAASVAGLGIGGNITVHSITQLSEILSISTTLLGFTMTAVATSLPELTLAVIASHTKQKQDNKVVIGTLIGSNIFNLTIFPAIVLYFSHDIIVTTGERLYLLLSSVILLAAIKIYKGKVVPRHVSVFFILMYGIFTLISLTTP